MCGKVKIGILCFGMTLFKTKLRSSSIPDEDKQLGVNMQTCISYPWARKFITGKLHASIACAMAYEKGYNFIETTSLYGKSIQYDRLPFFRYRGLTTGIGRAGLIFPPEFYTEGKKLLIAYAGSKTSSFINKPHSNTKKTMTTALLKESGLWDDGYRVENISVRRGYYLGILNKKYPDWKQKWMPPKTFDEAVEYWRKRWLVKRL